MSEPINIEDCGAIFNGWRCVVRTTGLCQGITDRLDAFIAESNIFPANQLPAGQNCKFVIYADPAQKILGMIFGSTDISHTGIYMSGLLGKGHEDPYRHELIDSPNSPVLCGGYLKKGVLCESSGDLGPAPQSLLELFAPALQEVGLSAAFNPDSPRVEKKDLVTSKIGNAIAASQALRTGPLPQKQRDAA